MPGERIGNSNQYLTISGVVSAPAYSWASDNDTGLYRIGANNIGVAASGAKVLDIATTGLTVTGAFAASNGVSSTLTTDATSATTGSILSAGGISMQKALWVGTTSRHVGATQFDAAITYGGVTLSNAVTGTGNMVLSASPTLTGTLTAATITSSGTVTGTLVVAPSLYVNASGPTGLVYGAASEMWFYAGGTNFARASISTLAFQSTYNITAGGSFTGNHFTATGVTGTGTNGLGLAAANTPAFYASTTEVLRATTALITAAKPIKATGFYTGSGTTVLAAGSPGAWATISAVPTGWAFFYCPSHTHPGYGGTAETFGDDVGSGLIRQATYNNVEFQVTGGNLQGRLIAAGAGLTLAWSYLLIAAT